MKYYHPRLLKGVSFEDAIERITTTLKEQGFGILTEIDVKATFKKKLDKDFRPYKILGACNPHFAFQAIENEEHIGVMLPCNVLVQEKAEGTEIAAVDPVASMQAVESKNLAEIAGKVRDQLKIAIDQA